MTEKHNLQREFPDHHDRIQHLRQTDGHFARLLAEHDAVDDAIRRMDDNLDPASDEHMETEKRRRLNLKDQLMAIILAPAA